MAGAGSVVGGIFCLAVGWAGFDLTAWIVARRIERGEALLAGDPTLLGLLSLLGAFSTLLFGYGVMRLQRGLTERRQWLGLSRSPQWSAALAQHAWLRERAWRERCIVFTTPVRGAFVLLAWSIFGLLGVFFIFAAIAHPVSRKGESVWAAGLLIGALMLFIVGGLTYWWLRKQRYGESVCRLLTLPGVAGGRFEADVDCALPAGPNAVTLRLRNMVPVGRRMVEAWRMEERVQVPVRESRTVVPVRLSVPRAAAQRFMPTKPGLRHWLFGAPAWTLEVEKDVPGIDFLARFHVPMLDLADAPATPLPPPPGHAPATASWRGEAAAAAVALAFGAGWLGFRSDLHRQLVAPDPGWLPAAQFQRELGAWSASHYPPAIEGRCNAGRLEYRSDWQPLPKGTVFRSWYGMTRRQYQVRQAEYAAGGFVLETTTTFRDCDGAERVQATWLKKTF